MRSAGAPEDVIRQQIQLFSGNQDPESKAQDVFFVLPENWNAFLIFDALATQWNISHYSGLRLGLDYSKIGTVCDFAGVKGKKKRKDLFARIRIMERAVLEKQSEIESGKRKERERKTRHKSHGKGIKRRPHYHA